MRSRPARELIVRSCRQLLVAIDQHDHIDIVDEDLRARASHASTRAGHDRDRDRRHGSPAAFFADCQLVSKVPKCAGL